MREIEEKISPLIQGMFPSFYNEEGPNFIAFVKAYYEWLETNFQLLELEDNTNFNIGDKVTQQDVQGIIVNYVGTDILVQIDGFNTFKCYNVCSELIPITSSSGGSTFIKKGGSTKRLSPLYMARNLPKLRDIDKTLDLFIVNFKEKYLKNIEFDVSSNKVLLVKNSLDLYRSKGTERSIDLFFRLVYGIKISAEYPGERLFSLSAGEWYSPSYIEISSESASRNIALVGKQIVGVTSGSTAFVEKYIKRKISSGFVHLLYISNIRGEFTKDELLKDDIVYSDSPKVLGSLSAVTIQTGGVNYNIGDTVTFTSPTGDKGLASVTSVRDRNGTVDFELLQGGWGYTVSSNAISLYSETDRTQTLISKQILTLDNVITGNTVSSISLVSQGFSYADTDVVNIVSPTANATARLVTGGGGAITDVILTSPGAGFTNTNPTIEILDQNGNINLSVSGGEFSLTFDEPKEYFRQFDIVEQVGNSANGTLIYSSTDGFITLSALTESVRVNDVLYQIGILQNASARVTKVITASLVSTVVQVDQITGVFHPYKPVYVQNRALQAKFDKMRLTIGVSKTTGTFSDTSNLLCKYNGTYANIVSTSTGSNAKFEVGSISNPQTAYLNTDLLKPEYLSLPLNAFTFNLPKNLDANINTVIFAALQFEPFVLGTVTTLSDINPGSNYSDDPKVLAYQPYLVGQNRNDYIFKIENLSRSFSSGEIIEQEYEVRNSVITLDTPTNLIVGEKIYTRNNINQFVSNGTIVSVNGLASVIQVTGVNPSIGTSVTLKSYSDITLTANVISATSFLTPVTAKAIVKTVSDTEIYAKRIQYDNIFKTTLPLIGLSSGATADILSIDEDLTVDQIGLNLNVDATSDSTEGAIANLRITDSGFGYQEGQSLIFTSNDNEVPGVAIAETQGIGRSTGYYKTSKGFLSSISKLHDGDYYQEYSYEIFSRIPIDIYGSMFKKVMHTAGTRFFGGVLIDSIINSNTSVISYSSNSSVEIIDGSPFVVEDRFDIDVQDGKDIDIEIRE